jgi:hypothetical protein
MALSWCQVNEVIMPGDFRIGKDGKKIVTDVGSYDAAKEVSDAFKGMTPEQIAEKKRAFLEKIYTGTPQGVSLEDQMRTQRAQEAAANANALYEAEAQPAPAMMSDEGAMYNSPEFQSILKQTSQGQGPTPEAYKAARERFSMIKKKLGR